MNAFDCTFIAQFLIISLITIDKIFKLIIQEKSCDGETLLTQEMNKMNIMHRECRERFPGHL